MYPHRKAFRAARVVCTGLLVANRRIMNVLIVGCGWVGKNIASHLLEAGCTLWATSRTPEKAAQLDQLGLHAHVVDFDREGAFEAWNGPTSFDAVVISVPVTRKDAYETVASRFDRLASFLNRLSFRQSFFFGSVGIYPRESAVVDEDSVPLHRLDKKLRLGETTLREAFPDVNVLRLGGLFGLERIVAKYFAGKVCEVGYQTTNFVHVNDICRILQLMLKKQIGRRTYNVVCPEHPLKKDVIMASAAKYGYDLPVLFTEADHTAKIVSSARLVAELDYSFVYRSPLQF